MVVFKFIALANYCSTCQSLSLMPCFDAR